MNSRNPYVSFAPCLMVFFFCATMAKAGKLTIDFDQPNGKPKTVPVGGGLDWRPLQGEWKVKNENLKKLHIEVKNCLKHIFYNNEIRRTGKNKIV